MRTVVDAKEFSGALDKVSAAAQKSRFVATLDRTLIQFCNGRCILTGTDFETWMTTEIPARGDDLSFVFHRTASAAKACRHFDGELLLELTETGEGRDRQRKLCMSCGSRGSEFLTLLPEYYPEMPEPELECSFTVNAASLLKRISRIKYATLKSSKGSDAYATSIQFSGNRIYCLDGLRAAWNTDDAVSVPKPFIAPPAPLGHLKVFGKQDVSVRLGKRYVDITDETTHLMFRQVEAVPFDLDSAVPKQFREEVVLCPDEFLAELAYLKDLLPAKQLPYVRFCGGRLLTRANECRCQTSIRLEGSSKIEIGFNLNLMADALRQFKGVPRVRMKLDTPISPILLEAEGRNDCALVLPVHPKYVPAAA